MTAYSHIKIANNLRQMSFKRASFNKQAIIGTSLSALIHAAGADADESVFKEMIRGGVKGLGADVGALLGAGIVGGTVYSLNPSTYKTEVLSPASPYFPGLFPEVTRRVVDYDNTGPVSAGAIGGGLAGGVGGYLLLDKIINSLDRKTQKKDEHTFGDRGSLVLNAKADG